VTNDNPNVTQWGQSFAYDGFGNLTDVTTIKGSTPELHTSYDPITNHGNCSDANGNTNGDNCGNIYYTDSYDIENRMARAGLGYSANEYYSYAPNNKRVWKGELSYDPDTGLTTQTTDEVTFWSVNGQKLAVYQLTEDPGIVNQTAPSFSATQSGTCYYFGGKMIKSEKGWVYTDRLGSIGKFYPYGVERPSATANGTEKFTGYFRDAETGLDYADQRYQSPGTGRFLTPDRMGGNPADPGSWNKYAYTRGDPVNRVDPGGMDDSDCPVNYCYVMNVTDTFSLLDLQPILDFGTGWSTGAMPWGATAVANVIATLVAYSNWAPQVDEATNMQVRPALIDRLTTFSGSNCDNVFSEALGSHYATGGFESLAYSVNFYFATTATGGYAADSNYTQDQVTGNGIQMTLRNSLGQFTGAATIIDHVVVPAIILDQGIVDRPGYTDILLHELLHADTRLDDGQLFSAFQNYGLVKPSDNSTSNISKWIGTDCKYTP
jgi:RHS repeat-associated protein